jgi:large subunit ribosomal protein L6
MSRIGRKPVPIPQGVQVSLEGGRIVVRGPRGELAWHYPSEMEVTVEDGHLVVRRPSDLPRHRALHGLTRALISNMVVGVSQGFEKRLELVGVGYRAQMQGHKLLLSVGYSHPVEVEPPPGIELQVEGTTQVIVRGSDKQLVGQVAANIRAIRPPEPYKGKGIRYAGEVIRRKAGKGAKGGKR